MKINEIKLRIYQWLLSEYKRRGDNFTTTARWIAKDIGFHSIVVGKYLAQMADEKMYPVELFAINSRLNRYKTTFSEKFAKGWGVIG